jgi:hypothetical protein
VYGFKVRRDVSVDEAIIEVKKYFVTGAFLNPRDISSAAT